MDDKVSEALKYVPMTYADALRMKAADKRDSIITKSVSASSLLALAASGATGRKNEQLSSQLLAGGASMGATYHLARLLGASAGGSLATSIVAGAIGAAAPVVLK